MLTFSRQGLTFDVTDAGPEDGRVVILLHGWPEDRHCWDEVIPALAEAGYRVLAPDQRGYSPGARPKGRKAYKVDELEADILALADAAGAARFEVVGHDWGAAVAWALAGRHPERVRSVAALSVPHTQAFLGSMVRSTQALRSWYMLFFQLPVIPETLLSLGGGKALGAVLARTGLDRSSAARYARRAAVASDMTTTLNWYRAIPFAVAEKLGRISVPALFIYGSGDSFISAAAVEACGAWVSAAYRYEELPGAGHWLPEDRPEDVSRLLLEHLVAT
ncbi:alpha/beta fold hydrolase [Acidiferrimicrobium sp. IK]|uniref:alpha/beta fold hydrolase n=1 Tax=Acidiferrimicrobium sp. IK TaxID=2871700 RepID=UPI0021CB8A2E|nr:alpha/beta fold hydrolase [Acidiferrimicrobium sp. IK]MCU4183343.1 alpha/beta fold hydrolase [Acidiferrimicrobium sp. IK]